MSRKDVEALDISGALGTLRQLFASRSIVERFQGRVDLFVEGYESDPRELYEIAEVRQFFRELDAAFPFWFYFLSTFGESFLLVLTFCLCRVTKMGAGHAMINPGDLQQFIERHFGAMNYIFDRFQLADSLNGKVSAEIARYYEEGGRQ